MERESHLKIGDENSSNITVNNGIDSGWTDRTLTCVVSIYLKDGPTSPRICVDQ